MSHSSAGDLTHGLCLKTVVPLTGADRGKRNVPSSSSAAEIKADSFLHHKTILADVISNKRLVRQSDLRCCFAL
jgi:hypothetical protein